MTHYFYEATFPTLVFCLLGTRSTGTLEETITASFDEFKFSSHFEAVKQLAYLRDSSGPNVAHLTQLHNVAILRRGEIRKERKRSLRIHGHLARIVQMSKRADRTEGPLTFPSLCQQIKKPYSSTLNTQFNSISVLSFSSVQRSKTQPLRSASGTSICQLNSNFFVISAAFHRLPANSAQIRRFPVLPTRIGVALKASKLSSNAFFTLDGIKCLKKGICFIEKTLKIDSYASYSPSHKSRVNELGLRGIYWLLHDVVNVQAYTSMFIQYLFIGLTRTTPDQGIAEFL